MDNITIAQYIEEKYRTEILDVEDISKYSKNDWLISAILMVLDKHPILKEKIDIIAMNIQQVIAIIERYFAWLQKRRALNQAEIFTFVTRNDNYRKLETFLLLLIVGYTFDNAFKRMTNNNKNVGEVLQTEATFSGVKCNVDYQIAMPIQKSPSTVKNFYELLLDPNVPKNLLEGTFTELKTTFSNRSSDSLNNSSNIFSSRKK